MDPKAMKKQLSQEEIAHIISFCSRLTSSIICTCGANLTSRYCIWPYYQPSALGGDHPKTGQKES